MQNIQNSKRYNVYWSVNFQVICISTHYALVLYKDSENSVQQFKGSCAYKLFSTTFSKWTKIEVQKAKNFWKIMELKFSGKMHIYKWCPYSQQRFRKLRGDALTNSSLIHSINGKKSKCKNSKIPGKLMEPEFPGTCNIHIYTLCPKG